MQRAGVGLLQGREGCVGRQAGSNKLPVGFLGVCGVLRCVVIVGPVCGGQDRLPSFNCASTPFPCCVCDL